MNVKLYDSELKVMEILWKYGDMRAAKVCEHLQEQIGWNPNTTYTIIKKCISKGYVERKNPGFWCRPLITREQAYNEETNNLINRLYQGSVQKFMAAFLKNNKETLTENELDEIKRMIDEA